MNGLEKAVPRPLRATVRKILRRAFLNRAGVLSRRSGGRADAIGRKVEAFVKTRPRVYDALLPLARRICQPSDPVYDFLDTFSRRHNRRVVFVQIGASDGLRNDPVREFIVRDAWRGILVEPLPAVFDLLRKNYEHAASSGLVFVNAAVSDSTCNGLTLHTFSSDSLRSLPHEERLAWLRKSSLDRSMVEGPAARLGKSYSEVGREIFVPSLTLHDLVDRYWMDGQIDLLVLDVEGHEAAILRSIDFRVLRPHAIFFESLHLGTEQDRVRQFLSERGYELTEMGADTAAVRPDGALRRP